MNVDITKWQKFAVSDVLEIRNGKGITADEVAENPGNLPAIQSGETEEGCLGYISREFCVSKSYTFTEEPCLTVARSGSAGYVGFHDNGCVVGDSAKILLLKESKWANKYVYMFLRTILMANKYKYDYGRKVTEKKYLQEMLLLPVKNGKPDWKFMENYIKKLLSAERETSCSLQGALKTNSKCNRKAFSVKDWKKFAITDIFEKFEIGKANNGMLNDGVDCLYLGAKKVDNCVMRKCVKDETLIHKGNCIIFICNGEGSVGYSNYIDRDFIASTDLVIAYASRLNQYNGLFLTTVIDRERPKYSFGRKWKTHLKNTIIELPATSTGEPDWQFMEDYIKLLPYGDRI